MADAQMQCAHRHTARGLDLACGITRIQNCMPCLSLGGHSESAGGIGQSQGAPGASNAVVLNVVACHRQGCISSLRTDTLAAAEEVHIVQVA